MVLRHYNKCKFRINTKLQGGKQPQPAQLLLPELVKHKPMFGVLYWPHSSIKYWLLGSVGDRCPFFSFNLSERELTSLY